MKKTKTALITGASSGIGKGLAHVHALQGGDVILVARREERLKELKSQLEKADKIKVEIVVKDLSIPGAGLELHEEVASLGLEVDYLINNAGFGSYGPFDEENWQDVENMLQVNLINMSSLCHAYIADFRRKGQGRILNVASSGGFLPGPLQAVYFASKAYAVSFSQAIANELKDSGITVTALCPGLTDTEFGDVAGVSHTQSFRIKAASADAVAKAGYQAMLKGKVLEIPGFLPKLGVNLLFRYFPRSWITWASRKAMEPINELK
ncbi:MAG: short-subunit dehydrogenase [Candidatus Omnitrophota bacterium]|jgi:short-subunit dehydrogenase